MSDYQFLQLECQAGNATVWLNRPERHNAFHQGLLTELPRCLTQLSQSPSSAYTSARRPSQISLGTMR